MLRLFTHTAAPGWRSIKVDGSAAFVSLAAMRDGQRDWTIYALNRSEQSQIVYLDGLPRETSLNVLTWNADNSGRIASGTPLQSNNTGALTVEIEPLSILAITTAAPRTIP
jgi:hypothetical protein